MANLGLISLGEERKAVGITISGKYVKALDKSGQPGLISQKEEICWREKRPSRPLPQIRRVRKTLDIHHFHYLSVPPPPSVCLSGNLPSTQLPTTTWGLDLVEKKTFSYFAVVWQCSS